MRVGIIGYKGSGKSLVAQVLTQELELYYHPLAKHLKSALSLTFGLERCFWLESFFKGIRINERVIGPRVIRKFCLHFQTRSGVSLRGIERVAHWDHPIMQTPRMLMQYFGTGIVRTLNKDAHVRGVLNFMGSNSFLADDVRFDNEFDLFDVTIYLERPGKIPPKPEHVSEDVGRFKERATFILENDGSIQDLIAKTLKLAKSIKGLNSGGLENVKP
ncbi:MAG: hypothetical protein CL489_06205 [Acidobacteria bacterium]|nr:hypothetical protein [Acidobacteriota bacterium]|tara:strand:- start:32407 stop:33057 length:651 start_codon:yes stop_codon:yes gene_type:complete